MSDKHQEASARLANELRRIAEIIVKRPVLGHWPHMRAELDYQILILAAGAMEQLGRDIAAVAEVGHRLMASQPPQRG